MSNGLRPIWIILDEIEQELMSYKLELSKGTVLGLEYWIVKPVGRVKWESMEAWCNEMFGPTAEDGIWTGHQRWYMNAQRFWFRNVKDRDWFILKWS